MVLRRLAAPLRRAALALRRRRDRGTIVVERFRFPPAPPPPGDGTFDGERAFALLAAQCALGPRVPGTEAHRRTADWLAAHLAATADEVWTMRWDQRISAGPGRGTTVPLTNFLALVRGARDGSPDVMLSAHWDTRPVADQDPDPARRGDPVPGANDGASGVAVVLEAARALRARRPARTVALALWDGEDLGEYYYGSHAYAAAARTRHGLPFRARRGILLDMVGKRDLRCTTERNSMAFAPALWRRVHAAADALGHGAHFGGPERAITDDHVFLTRAGTPTVLLIDYTDPRWHTTHDTVAHCEPRSLQVVGDVVLHVTRDEGRRRAV